MQKLAGAVKSYGAGILADQSGYIRIGRSAGASDAKLLSKARSSTAIRNSQSIVTGGNNLSDATRMMRGTDGNIGVIPKEIADNLRGRTFNNFDEFRSAFWQGVGNSKMQMNLILRIFQEC